MASAGLRAELECSICLSTYTDPVMLRCGHNFCRLCIDRVLDTQEGDDGGYSCPECREKFQEWPALHRNITLRNIVENFLPPQPHQEGSGVSCTYCVDSLVPAVISCLLCDVSLCDKHLRVHSKSPEHVLCHPTTNMEDRRCSVHKKILEYYCTEDSTCICVSCRLDGQHKGHQVSSLEEASEQKKQKLRDDLQEAMTQREEMENKGRSHQERRRKEQETAAGETERVTAMFRDLRRQLEELEKRVLEDIARWAERVAMPCDEMVQRLEIKMEELSRKMRHIEELCNMTDPLTVLQEPDTGDLCDTEEGDNGDTERHDEENHDGGDLDVAAISLTLHTISDAISQANRGVYIRDDADMHLNVLGPANKACLDLDLDIILDATTAHNKLEISDDGKTASLSDRRQNRPDTPERFHYYPQVMSSQGFSSGQHYWEVDFGGSDIWRVGMCYPSIARRGSQSLIGGNNKSWGMYRYYNQCLVIHDSKEIQLPAGILSGRVRVYLDYEAGQISFYALCDPITPLHTFTTTFTEPLHAAVYVWRGCIKISGGKSYIEAI